MFDLAKLKFIYKGHPKMTAYGNEVHRQEVIPHAINLKEMTVSCSVFLANPDRDSHPNFKQKKDVLTKVPVDHFEITVRD